MSTRTLATQLVAIGVLRDLLSTTEKEIRAELERSMIVGERAAAAVIIGTDVTPVGTVTAKKKNPGGDVVAKVTDPAALLAWAKEHAPTEVRVVPAVEEVRSSFLPALLEAVAKDGGWHDDNGELVPVDGVENSVTGPSGGGLMVVKAADAASLIQAAIASGAFNVRDVLAVSA